MSTVVILSIALATLSIILLFVIFSWLDARRNLKYTEQEANQYLVLAQRRNDLFNELKDSADDVMKNYKESLDATTKKINQLEKVVKLKEKTNQGLLDSIKQDVAFIEELQSQHKEERDGLLAQLNEKQVRYDTLYHNFTFLLNVLAENTPNKPFFARNKLLAAKLETLVYDYTQSTITVGIPDEIIDKAYLQYNGVGGVVIKPRIDAPKVK